MYTSTDQTAWGREDSFNAVRSSSAAARELSSHCLRARPSHYLLAVLLVIFVCNGLGAITDASAEPPKSGEAGIDVAGGMFDDSALDSDPNELALPEDSDGAPVAASAEPANPMLPPAAGTAGQPGSPYRAKAYTEIYEGIGAKPESEVSIDAVNMFQDEDEKEEPFPQAEVAKKVIDLIKPKLDQFQKAELSVIERAQKKHRNNKSDQLKSKIGKREAEIKRKMAVAKAAAIEQVKQIQKDNARKQQQEEREKNKPGLEVAAFGFDGQDQGTQPQPESENGAATQSQPSVAEVVSGLAEDNGTTGPSANTAVVSLYVNALPEATAQKLIDELAQLRDQRNVAIGNLVLVGLSDARAKEFISKMLKRDTRVPVSAPRDRQRRKSDQQREELRIKVPFETQMMAKYKLHELGFVRVQDLFKRLQVKISPVWVVRWRGKDHVLEGRDSIWGMITKEGQFVGPDALAEQNFKAAESAPADADAYQSPTTLEDDSTPLVHYEVPGTGADFKLSNYSELRFGS